MIKSIGNLSLIKKQYLFTLLSIFVAVSISSGESLKERFSEDRIKQAQQLLTFRSFGTIKMGETIGTIETFYSKPGVSRSTLALGNFLITQIFDGRQGWMKDQNGQVIELTGPDKRQLINTGWLLGKSYLLESALAGELAYIKDTIIASINYSIYSALPDGGDSLKLYFNPKTSRIEIIGENLDEVDIFTFLTDFRDLNGFEMAYKYETRSTIPELNSTVEVHEFEVNLPLNDTLFAFTITPADDYTFPENADSIIVPMVYERGHIFLKAAINGYPAVYFILDTGAGINFINRRYADSLRLDLSGGIPAKGMSGYETTAITELNSLKIGHLNLLNQKVAIIDLTGVGLNVPDGILGGLIGYDLLSRFPLRIDYLNENIILYDPAKYQPPSKEYAVNIEFSMKVPLIDAELDGISGKFLIDLGNALGLILHKPFVDNNNLIAKFTDINKIANEISGVGGKSDTYSALVEYFAFGPVNLGELRVLVAEGEQGILKSTDVDGNIGNGLLQNFSVTFDYPAQKVYILPLEK